LAEVSNHGVSISYEVTGQGRPLVLLHGWACDRSWWTESGYLDPNGESLRLPGLGFPSPTTMNEPRKARSTHAGGEAIMYRIRLALVLMISLLAATILWTEPALADTKVTTVHQNDFTYVNSDWCDFRVRFHVFGTWKETNYFDDSGFLYKTIATAGPGGRFTQTASANGATLTMQMQSFMQVNYYNPDGTIDTVKTHGVDLKFTSQGSGIVLQAVGTVVFDGDFNVIWTAGPNQWVSGDFEEFCAALS
jgi:hypothetical protein